MTRAARAKKGAPAVTTTSAPNETLSIPIDGLVQAQVRIGFGGGELTIRPAAPGMLIGGTFEGGVAETSRVPGMVELEPLHPGSPFLTWEGVRWDVGVTGEIPVDLRLDTGANRSMIDLSALRIRHLELHTGASETRIRLPAGGQTAVRIDCGFAAVSMSVPPAVAARIGGKISLGATEVDEGRFPRFGEGWQSRDYETALDRVDISIAGGFGSVRIF